VKSTVFMLSLLVLARAAATAQSGPSSTPLLRIHSTLHEIVFGPVALLDLDEDLFIRRDGSVSGIVSEIVENNRSTWVTTGARTTFGSTDKLIALRRAMEASRVGFLTGECALPSQPTGRTFGEGTYELTWYGWRRTTILFRIGGSGEPCSSAVAGLVQAVEEYAFSAGLSTTGLWTGS
jgi:hypothetical protein